MSNTVQDVREVTLAEILDAREKRCELQMELLNKYGATLISFTMNIAGPIKNTPLIDRAFRYGYAALLKRLPSDKILHKISFSDPCGCSAFISVDLSAKAVKEICMQIEESCALGRFFDMDVLDQCGKKLERDQQRSCIICGKPGRACAAGRLHPVEDLIAITTRSMTAHFAKIDAENIGNIAVECLVREVETTPKPGLVDLRNNGSHTDMDVNTFRKSAHALRPYFIECISIGMLGKQLAPAEVFASLRAAGLDAERDMYEATGGVNTHKGLIYSMGVLLGAIGLLWTADKPIAARNAMVNKAAALVIESTISDFNAADGKTAGEQLYLKYGLRGIRGEVASGFSSVLSYSLPIYEEALAKGASPNDAGIRALLSLISSIDDTNLYHRGGREGAIFAKKYAEKMINCAHDISMIERMDDEFIERGLSPGGAADLLAITYFLHSIMDIK